MTKIKAKSQIKSQSIYFTECYKKLRIIQNQKTKIKNDLVGYADNYTFPVIPE
jgi:hypothetical protein